MALINFAGITYLPYLSLRPSEMRALEELPERDKDLISPLFQLRRWGASHNLDSSVARIEEAYGDRPYFIELGPIEIPDGERRAVHDQLDQLRSPEDGAASWCEFISDHRSMIPSLLIVDQNNFRVQGVRLEALGRGLLLRIPLGSFAAIPLLCEAVASFSSSGRNVIVMLDYERQSRDLLTRTAAAVALTRQVQLILPLSQVCFSASSFPDSFANLDDQDIYERQFFDGISIQLAEPKRLLYSDRGSARAERQAGGGGAIPPRIDYANETRWTFFRSNEAANRAAGFRTQAQAAMASDDWDDDLRLWGTQMIERTAAGDLEAITSQARSTAARINIHLHRQLFRGDPGSLYNTDEDWID